MKHEDIAPASVPALIFEREQSLPQGLVVYLYRLTWPRTSLDQLVAFRSHEEAATAAICDGIAFSGPTGTREASYFGDLENPASDGAA